MSPQCQTNQTNEEHTIEEDHHRYDIESAYAEMGGFGKFQWLTAITLTLARNGGNWMYYGFAYLTMEQMYKCQFEAGGPFVSCSAEEQICPALAREEGLVQYQVDTTYEYYLDNWYVQMDLVCTNKMSINSIISAKYIVYGIAAHLTKFGLLCLLCFIN